MEALIVIGMFVVYGLICLLVADGVMVMVEQMERARAQRAWLDRSRRPSPSMQSALDRLKDLVEP